MEEDTSAVATEERPSTASPSPDADGLSERLAKVYHDLNNSLSVIYGNTQLLSEMARADDLGAAFAEPLEDIEAARAELSDTLEEIDDMRRETKAGDS